MTPNLINPDQEAIFGDIDFHELDRLLDRTKAKVFLSRGSAAFLGSLLCSLDFAWVSDIKTAATNGKYILWNPYFFLDIEPEARVTVMLHELWHVALLHHIPMSNRIHWIFNQAADYVINGFLHEQGYTFPSKYPGLHDKRFAGMSSEEVYEILLKEFGGNAQEDQPVYVPPWGHEDLADILKDLGLGDEDADDNPDAIIPVVIQARDISRMAGEDLEKPGNTPGSIETVLKRFLNPKLPWDVLLKDFFNELDEYDYTFRRPNRRHQEVYLPSLVQDAEGAMDHVVFIQDVSGSVSDRDILRMTSEVKHIWDHYSPKKLTILLFDTKIQKEIVFENEDNFDEVKIIGRGGTDLTCVHKWITENNPSVCVLFSDLQCPPMQDLPNPIPFLWIGVNASKSHQVRFGKLIHIEE